MKLLSLFSGIGAFEKALERLDIEYELAGYCEIDKYASRAYSLIHGVDEDMNLGDITKIDPTELPSGIDMITYGFPCQDISNAGKMKGLFNEDGTQTRSGLFFEALRIIEGTKPKYAIAENVKNLTSKKFGQQFETVLNSLEQAGYNNYWKVLNAKDYGVPQNRERVFIVSIRKDVDNGEFTFPESIPLQLRLKDMLEDEIDEKFYVSDVALKGFVEHARKQREKGNSFHATIKDSDDIGSTIKARYYKDGSDCLVRTTESKCIQVGQLYGTEKEPNPQAGRVYDADALSPTISTCQGGNRMPKVVVEEATKQGYAEAVEGDSINLEQPNSKTRRGRVGKGVAQTLTTSCNQAVVEPMALDEQNKYLRKDGCVGTLTTDGSSPKHNNRVLQPDCRVRKLTPKECFRLMGFDDVDVDILKAKGMSNTQLYKMAGNSIVVDVLEKLFESLIR